MDFQEAGNNQFTGELKRKETQGVVHHLKNEKLVLKLYGK